MIPSEQKTRDTIRSMALDSLADAPKQRSWLRRFELLGGAQHGLLQQRFPVAASGNAAVSVAN